MVNTKLDIFIDPVWILYRYFLALDNYITFLKKLMKKMFVPGVTDVYELLMDVLYVVYDDCLETIRNMS